MHKVFLASTYEDLKEHRLHVIKRLRAANFSVDPMEEWGADPREPKQFSRDYLKGCQLMVLLVAFRRGFVPENETLSITQMEYEAACEAGMDVLVFQLTEDEDLKWYRNFDELDKDPLIRPWRDQLMQDRGVGFFRELPESLDIDRALLRWLSERLQPTKFGAIAGNLAIEVCRKPIPNMQGTAL